MNKSNMTIDWEDFSQLYAKYHYNVITKPDDSISRQTDIILELLDSKNVKATFFILGITAKYRKYLVLKIKNLGHEIACHGHFHDSLDNITKEEIKEDLIQSTKLIEDITGEKLFGYRAPFFSLTEDRLYVLEILAELGYVYDSSIMPSKMVRNGIAGFDKKISKYTLKNSLQIIELPIKPVSVFSQDFVIAGGGYMRFTPMKILNKIYKINIAKGNSDLMLYMHPYEFDSHNLDVSNNYPPEIYRKSLKVNLINFKWNINRKSLIPKLSNLFDLLKFETCAETCSRLNHSLFTKVLNY